MIVLILFGLTISLFSVDGAAVKENGDTQQYVDSDRVIGETSSNVKIIYCSSKKCEQMKVGMHGMV